MDACLICHLQNLFDPFGVVGLGIGAAGAVGSGLALGFGGIDRLFRRVGDSYDDYTREPPDPRDVYYPPAGWSLPLVPDPNGYIPPIDLNTGKPFTAPEYDPHHPPMGWQNAYWSIKEKRWIWPDVPADLFGARG